MSRLTSPAGQDVTRADWVALAALAGAGFLLGGPAGLVVALLGVAAAARGGGHAVARAAFVLLGLAALATVFESGRMVVGIDLVARRPLAGAAARAASILALVALVAFASAERRPAPAPPAPPRPIRLRSPGLAAGLSSAYASVVALGLAVRLLAAPPALPPGYATVVARLQAADGFGTALRPPLASVLAAFAPGGARAALVLASTLTVVAVMRLAWLCSGPRASVLAGLVAALLPSLWGQQLPEALAALGLTAALGLLWPWRLDTRRAVLGGLALAGAVLARPEAALAVPVALAWVALSGRPDRLRPAAAAVAVAVVAVAPWQLSVHRSFDTWLPTTSLGPTLVGSTRDDVLSGPATGSFRPTALSRPGGDEGSRDRRARAEGLRRWRDARMPHVVAVRVLRGWDLWPGQGHERARRHLPFPGGRAGVAAEVVAAALTAATLLRLRPRWRHLLPLFALPLLFTLVSAVTFGDRGLKYLAAPAVATVSGLALAAVRRARPAPRSASPAGTQAASVSGPPAS